MPQPPLRIARLAFAVLVAVAPFGASAAPTAAAGGLTMTAKVLLQGHARQGSWMGIEVLLENAGPEVVGELRMEPAAGSTTRFSMAVDVPTGGRETYVLHAQPPVFGRNLTIDLVSNGTTVATQTVAYLVHDPGQLIVGVLAERPQGIVSELALPPSQTGAAAVIVPLTVADLPDRVEGWAPLDRLIWQDVDSSTLSTGQLAALRGWIAGGGRLVIAGGTSGIGTLGALPDDLLPYRPSATVDLDPSTITSLVGALPAASATLPAMAGSLTAGHALASFGDRTVAATMAYGSGEVTIIGFDPTTSWLAQSKAIEGFWLGLLPPRGAGSSIVLNDDSQLLGAVQQLPSAALPPVGGLLILLAAYILVVGPINYLILRRLDRRELAWLSVPVLVLGFAAAAYGYGSTLRGNDVIVNEVAIIQGAPDATEGQAQDYFGVFSPSRATYQVTVPGALLAGPISGDSFGGTSGVLDIVQGDPAQVRDLAVGVAQLRTVRAQTETTVPKMHADLTLGSGTITGTFRNDSDQALEQVSIVLGSSVASLGDVAPHASVPVQLVVQSNPFGMPLADQVVGSQFTGGFGSPTEADVRRQIRYSMLGELTFDPTSGFQGGLQADQPVVLAFGRTSPIDIRVGGQSVKRTTNVLYYVPVDVAVHGQVTFSADLVRPTILSTDSMFFNKGGPGMFNMGGGSLTVAYRPIPFTGTLAPTTLRIGFNSGNGILQSGGKPMAPLPSPPPTCTDALDTKPAGCVASRNDGLPDTEIFDRSGGGTWMRLPRMDQDAPYLVDDPARYIDPASGQVLLRFVNDNANNQIGFGFSVSIEGSVQ